MIALQRLLRPCSVATLLVAMLAIGCAPGPVYLQPEARRMIDRAHVEFPAGFRLAEVISGLTAPSTIAFVNDEGDYHGAMLIAETGAGRFRPRIYGYKRDGAFFEIYPSPQTIPLERVPVPFGLFKSERVIYGPIGGMVVTHGKIFVTHRDANGRGVISAFDFDGRRTTIAADLPAQGDHSLTDIVVHPTTGRLYFGVGAATNSGVVGLDNWQSGWIKRYPKFCDSPAVMLKLLGYRFDTRNPEAGIFGGDDIAVTAPFQPFGVSDQTRIPAPINGKPSSAIYSVSPEGGDLRVEAWGIRVPRGLGINEYYNLYFTNNGMELRGTRPVKDDPDSFLKLSVNTWYGFPDFSSDLLSIAQPRFQPPIEMIQRTGYPELSELIDRAASKLDPPSDYYRESLLFGVMPSLSGAAKFDFAPRDGAFREFRGHAIIALSGDRAPFATSGRTLKAPVGFKIVRLDLATKRIHDFVFNQRGGPGSRINKKQTMLERPTDIKFAPDGNLYILDYGRMEMKNGRERIIAGTGRVFALEPIEPTTTAPASR